MITRYPLRRCLGSENERSDRVKVRMRPTDDVLALFSVTEQRLHVPHHCRPLQLAFGKDTTKDGPKPRTHRVRFTLDIEKDWGKTQIEVCNKSLNCILRHCNFWHFRDGDIFVSR